MLDGAARLRESCPAAVRDRIGLAHSAAQSLDLKRRFAAVVSLFHVLSYQVTQEQLCGFLGSAARHLAPGGVFLFDFWYGPAVLFQRPEMRSRKVSADGFDVHRVAVPELEPARNVVHVHYDTYVRRAGAPALEHVTECHSMRYFFEAELRAVAGGAGFEAVRFEEWLTGKPPGVGTWGVTGILRRI
jgi:SAM-dependent methyltransferase